MLRKSLSIVLVSGLLMSQNVGAVTSDEQIFNETKTRINQLQLTDPNLPTGADPKGSVGGILSRLFDSNGLIRSRFLAIFDTNTGDIASEYIPNLDTSKITTGTFDFSRISNISITSSMLASNAITSAKIQDGTVTGADIAGTTITNANISNSAAILGTKISPNFGSQNIITTGNITGNYSGNGSGLTNLNASNITTGIISDAQLPTDLVRNSRTITAGDGLSGGGNLGANRTLSVDNTVVRTTGDQTIGGTKTFSSPIAASITGNAATATTATTANTLTTARTIGGVSFNGSANINLPGVNIAGNQNTTGNAATATRLQTARTINGVSFNGTANITLPTVNTSGNQTIAGVKTFSSPIVGQNPTAANHLTTKSYVDELVTQGVTWKAPVETGETITGKWGACDTSKQSWTSYNKNDDIIYICDGANWMSIGSSASIPYATTATAGRVQLAGDIGGTWNNITINNNAITTAKLSNNAITSAKIQDGTVTGADIADNTITAQNLASNSVGDYQMIDSPTFFTMNVTGSKGISWENGVNSITHNDGGGHVQIRFGHDFSSGAERFTHSATAFKIGGALDINDGALELKVATNGGAGDNEIVSWGPSLLVGPSYLRWGGSDILTTSSSIPFSSITSTPTNLAGYGITDAVPNSRTITAGDGLIGGGNLGADRTLSVDSTVLRTTGNQIKTGDLWFNGGTRYIGTLDDNQFRIRTNNINRMTILNNGDVGIGTISPLEKLDVNGKIRMRMQTSSGDTVDTVATKGYVDSIAAGDGLGIGQSWQDLTASRSRNTSYQNTTGKPIMVIAHSSGDGGQYYQVSTDNSTWVNIAPSSYNEYDTVSFVVPAGHYYRLTGQNGFGSIYLWSELR